MAKSVRIRILPASFPPRIAYIGGIRNLVSPLESGLKRLDAGTVNIS